MRRSRVVHVSPQGLTWLALLEGGFRLNAYRDSAGVWTISAGVTFYSHSLRVRRGDRLKDVEAAEELFRARLLEFEAEVDARTQDSITQTHFDALVSFCYNIGQPAFRNSTALARYRNKEDLASVAQAMGWFNKIRNPTTGKLEYSAGLMERRKCEAYLLMYGLYRTQGEVKA